MKTKHEARLDESRGHGQSVTAAWALTPRQTECQEAACKSRARVGYRSSTKNDAEQSSDRVAQDDKSALRVVNVELYKHGDQAGQWRSSTS